MASMAEPGSLVESQSIRVVLVNGSHLLREMLERVFSKLPDFEIAGFAHDLTALQFLLRSVEADWFVITARPDEAITKQAALLRSRFPETRILVIAPDASEVLVNWLEPREARMERASLQEIIAVMRSPGHVRHDETHERKEI